MSWLDDAIAARPHAVFDPIRVARDAYGRTTAVAFERGRNVDGSHPYVTCWVMRPAEEVYRRDATGRAPPEHAAWARDLVAQALGIPPARVALGFGFDQIDVRPF